MMPLMRLRYGGSANRWGFALYLASHNGYRDQILPTGFTAGTPEEALDCAAGLYLPPPTNPRRTYEPDHLLSTDAPAPDEVTPLAVGCPVRVTCVHQFSGVLGRACAEMSVIFVGDNSPIDDPL